ncbi:MAG: ABC transporter ATP-binding protein [Chloroflexota bacterium]|nr:ABC transporter ATP-binding protein [Chloroflexota bacterium]
MEPLLEVKNLKVRFATDEGPIEAVRDVSFEIKRGETVAIVGESGCGKSVMARAILRIVPAPGNIVEGQINYYRDGRAIELTALEAKGAEIRAIRGADIAMIFQEPMATFSPVHTIGNQINEAIILHQGIDHAGATAQTLDILNRVGMPRPSRIIHRYPHQLSGGMLQRAMIAMALSCRPQLLIADEPTTALDVTTQAQILRLLYDLQREFNMAILFITHDLSVVSQFADRVEVMYLGEVVESTDVITLFEDPKHPYTRALLNSIPQTGAGRGQRLQSIAGSIPNPLHRPSGCLFHPRCDSFQPGVCDLVSPKEIDIDKDHRARCILYDEQYSDRVSSAAFGQ